jgi:signal transduction histidine kinase
MEKLIGDMLELARVTRAALHRQSVDLSAVAGKIVVELRRGDRQRVCGFECDAGLSARVDPRLFRLVIENLIGNAWKYTATREDAWIHFGSRRDGNKTVFFVEDNGVGFDMHYADRLFSPFQRLHGTEFEGTGIGLASVARIIRRHGGDYWGTGEVGKGACFYFTVSDDGDSRQTRTAARPPAGGPTEVSRLVAAAPEQPKHLQG